MKLNEQCSITKITLTISDKLPKGREEGKDNRIFNCTINSADLPIYICVCVFSPSGERVGLAQK